MTDETLKEALDAFDLCRERELGATPWPMNSTGRSTTTESNPLGWAQFAFNALPIPGLPGAGGGFGR